MNLNDDTSLEDLFSNQPPEGGQEPARPMGYGPGGAGAGGRSASSQGNFVQSSQTADVGDLDAVIGNNSAPRSRQYIYDSMSPTWQGASVGAMEGSSEKPAMALATAFGNIASVLVAGAATFWLTRDWKPALGVAALAWGSSQLPHAFTEGKTRLLMGVPAVAAGAGLLWWSQVGVDAVANDGFDEDDDDEGDDDADQDEGEGEGEYYESEQNYGGQGDVFGAPSGGSSPRGRPNWIKPSKVFDDKFPT